MLNKSHIIISVAVVVLGVGLIAGAQGRRQGYGFGQCTTCQTNFDLANRVSLEGTVESVNMGRGQGYPTFTLLMSDGTRATVVTSPFRVLLNTNYKIALGDHMAVLAFPSLQQESTFIAAELKNFTNGTELTLRDAAGTPVDGLGEGCCGCAFGNINGTPGQGRR